MTERMIKNIASFYGWKNELEISSIRSGLINHTWKIKHLDDVFIFQCINKNIFKQPEWIDENINLLSDYLSQKNPDYLFTDLVKGVDGKTMFVIDGAYYRSFRFVKGSHTIDVVQNPQQAYEAAFQFGKFTSLLDDFDTTKLRITLPDFHNLGLRFIQLQEALQTGNAERIEETKKDVVFLQSQKNIVDRWVAFVHNKDAKQRVTHHDTKISNILLDENDKGICVIDLDTIMPGFFISDVGDMMRTYLSPVSEEEPDLDKIIVRKDLLKAIQDGYLTAIANDLSNFEKDHFLFSGEVLIYMQALRFLTDYINNDMYYGRKYEKHNLVRARNQIRLLQEYQKASER
jgi:Ser/Thr protein kinase RdoA (MazF antagonist)